MGILTRKQQSRQSGFTLMELMIAMAVFMICMLAIAPLFMLAIGNNGRSKLDTTSTELSQSVIEQISAVLARGGPPKIADCGSHSTAATGWDVYTSPTQCGAVALNASGSGIDFAKAKVDGCHMDFQMCGNTAGQQSTYDVRWRIEQLHASSYLVTVSARPVSTQVARFFFALPVTPRTYVGP